MIIQKDYYKRNAKTGDIVNRQRIWVKCDSCKKEWETQYACIKRSKLTNNLCASCRNKQNNIDRKPQKRKKICCSYCQKEFYSSVNSIKKQNCCSRDCSDKNYLKNKYGHLEKIFEENIDEVSYLFGVILGDGSLKKTEQKNTTRVTVAFDVFWPKLMDIFLNVCDKLQILYHIEPKTHSNCQHIGFVLTDSLLSKYQLDFVGDKYKAQPVISEEISSNINFAAGMINSDGSCVLIHRGERTHENIRISGVTKTIIDSCSHCLTVNNISYRKYYYEGRVDKRTGNLNKGVNIIHLGQKKEIQKIREKTSFNIKEASNM